MAQITFTGISFQASMNTEVGREIQSWLAANAGIGPVQLQPAPPRVRYIEYGASVVPLFMSCTTVEYQTPWINAPVATLWPGG